MKKYCKKWVYVWNVQKFTVWSMRICAIQNMCKMIAEASLWQEGRWFNPPHWQDKFALEHWLWWAELLQLLQELHPLISLLGAVTDVQLPLEVLKMMVPRKQKDSTMSTRHSHRVMGVEGGWILCEVNNLLHCQSVELCHLHMDCFPSLEKGRACPAAELGQWC